MTQSKPVIAVEEHFVIEELDSFKDEDPNGPHAKAVAPIMNRLKNLGDNRIAEMDEAGVAKQIVSLTAPGTQQLERDEAIQLSTKANNLLGEAVQKHPERLAGFATLPTIEPELAAQELERTVNEFGFKGAIINGHTLGEYLDHPKFEIIFEKAEQLNVPIYLHPAIPPENVIDTYYKGNYSSDVAMQFASAGWGWHIETAIHLIRIVLSGTFDKYPDLKIVTGHNGEGVLYALQRLDTLIPPQLSHLKKKVSDYLKENIYYSISGYTYAPPFMQMYEQIGADHILYSSDYPYVSMKDTLDFVDQLDISEEDKDKILYKNAQQLFNL